jgi:hypothetical protein
MKVWRRSRNVLLPTSERATTAYRLRASAVDGI